MTEPKPISYITDPEIEARLRGLEQIVGELASMADELHGALEIVAGQIGQLAIELRPRDREEA